MKSWLLMLLPWLMLSARVAEGQVVEVQDRQALRKAQEAARTRIESGELSPTELASEQLTLATTSARLGDAESSQRAFRVLLALDPSFRLPASFSDEVRSPYLEARGFWSAHEVPLDVKATFDEGAQTIRLKITDPAPLSVRVRLRARADDSNEIVEVVRPVAPELQVDAVAWGTFHTLAYSLTLIDEFGNRIWQRGSDERPESLQRTSKPRQASSPVTAAPKPVPAAAPIALAPIPEMPPPASPPSRRHAFRLAASLTMAGAALSLAGAGYAHFRREQLAEDWNSVRCRGQGLTRSEVCADERAELSRMQNLAIGLYSIGGAALITGVVLLALTPPRSEDPGVLATHCHGGSTPLSLACTVRF